jgi:hypothetical protein
MLLEKKNAIIYGAGGGIGGGVARTFAREGARVFLAGRTGPPLEAVAADVRAAGGSAEVAVLDATDERAVDAHVEAVTAGAVALVREDIRITMPPHPWCFDGLATIRPLLEEGLTAPGEWRLVPTRANRQPTAASYLRAPGDTEFRALKFDVLRLEGGRIAEITTFDATLFPEFGLPPTL